MKNARYVLEHLNQEATSENFTDTFRYNVDD